MTLVDSPLNEVSKWWLNWGWVLSRLLVTSLLFCRRPVHFSQEYVIHKLIDWPLSLRSSSNNLWNRNRIAIRKVLSMSGALIREKQKSKLSSRPVRLLFLHLLHGARETLGPVHSRAVSFPLQELLLSGIHLVMRVKQRSTFPFPFVHHQSLPAAPPSQEMEITL